MARLATFAQLIDALDQGETAEEAMREFVGLVRQVLATGNKGALTLKLEVAYDGASDILIKDTISIRRPTHSRRPTEVSSNGEGALFERPTTSPIAGLQVAPATQIVDVSGMSINVATGEVVDVERGESPNE